MTFFKSAIAMFISSNIMLLISGYVKKSINGPLFDLAMLMMVMALLLGGWSLLLYLVRHLP